ncbi:MAG TPA: hypothetical protein VGV09_03180 [Steroidobacteraceae bacterium]|nr:hypothetical protein [Steroidobacteraceae bacterium]
MNSPLPDIRDIRAPYLIPADWRGPALVAAVALLVLAFCWWAWRRLRARHRPLTLLQRTLQQLEATRALMEAGDARAFSAAVSDVVRAYIEVRFEVRATQRTTAEFLGDCLAQVGSALQAHEPALAEFLKYCDLAKFARWPLDAQQMQGMLASARHFVETTAAPVPAPPVTAPEVINVPIRQS